MPIVIVAVDKNGVPGLMGLAETLKEAITIQGRATQKGWLNATICHPPGLLQKETS